MSRTEIFLIVFVLVAFGLGRYQGFELGASVERSAAQQRERVISDEWAQALAKVNERNRQAKAAVDADLAKISDFYVKAFADEQLKRDRFIAGVRSGAIRLSIPVVAAGSAACATRASADPATAAGDLHEARAELDPAAAEALATIAHDGDAAIVQLNACIDGYSSVRARLNALATQGRADAQAQ